MEELNEKLSVGELKIYEGFYDGKERYVPLTKVFVARDENTAFDVISGDEYAVYQKHNGMFYPGTKNTNSELQLGDMFCTIEKDLKLNEDIFNYMIESNDFFFQRLPYLQERFNLYNNQSSFLVLELKKLKNKISKDIDKKMIMNKLMLEIDELKKYATDENSKTKGKVYIKNTNRK